ncbi:hypothetical protein MKW92_012082 [Papaver armeniacum]|nr:hypothetical protein MKW92_012082 [Papaver armeniacum]
MISLSKVIKGKKDDAYRQTCNDMVVACENWGFCKLIDHGIKLEIIENMKNMCSDLFDLPMEKKMKGGRLNSLPLGYSATNPDYGKNLPWAEIIQLLQSPQQVVGFATKVYGDQYHHKFSDAMLAYMEELDKLGMLIFEMLADGLGLPSDFFSKNFKRRERSNNDKSEQISKMPAAREIAWYIAVVNKERSRLSAYFLSPSSQVMIESPPQPRTTISPNAKMYKPFTWGDFRKELLSQKRVSGKTASTDTSCLHSSQWSLALFSLDGGIPHV